MPKGKQRIKKKKTNKREHDYYIKSRQNKFYTHILRHSGKRKNSNYIKNGNFKL